MNEAVAPVVVDDEHEEEHPPEVLTIVSAFVSPQYISCELCGGDTEAPHDLTVMLRTEDGDEEERSYSPACEECAYSAQEDGATLIEDDDSPSGYRPSWVPAED